MNISVELYATRFGNNNITEAFQNKECGIRLDFEENSRLRASVVLSIREAEDLLEKLVESLASNQEFLIHSQ